MKAFLLAAGRGSRLRPLTDRMPKPLVAVDGVACLCLALLHLREAGLRSVVCNLHHLGGQIRDYFAENDNFGFDIVFSEEEHLLGTGGGIARCRGMFEGEDLLVLNADVVTDARVVDLIARHHRGGAEATLLLARPVAGDACSIAVEGDRVVGIARALDCDRAPTLDYTGVAVLSPGALDLLGREARGACLVRSVFAPLAARRRLGCLEHTGMWLDIGTPERLASAQGLFARHPDLLERLCRAGLAEPHRG